MHVDDDILKSIIDFECLHTLLTKIWELYGDPNIYAFLVDLVSISLVPLHFSERITYDCDTIQEFDSLENYETSKDEDEVSLEVPNSSSKIVDIPSPSLILCTDSLIETSIILILQNHLNYLWNLEDTFEGLTLLFD